MLTVNLLTDSLPQDGDCIRVATSGDLARLLSKILDIPFATVDLYGRNLRKGNLLNTKGHGPRSAARMTRSDAANWLISLAVDHKRGGDFIDEVLRVRALPLLDGHALPPNIVEGLRFPSAANAGEAIEAAFDDAHAPIFAKMLSRREDCFTVGFDSEGQTAYVSLSPGKVYGDYRQGLWTYQGGEKKRRMIERTVSIHGAVLYEIATALGPPEET